MPDGRVPIRHPDAAKRGDGRAGRVRVVSSRTLSAEGRPIKPLFSHGPVPSYRMLLCAVLAFTLMFAEHRLSFMEACGLN